MGDGLVVYLGECDMDNYEESWEKIYEHAWKIANFKDTYVDHMFNEDQLIDLIEDLIKVENRIFNTDTKVGNRRFSTYITLYEDKNRDGGKIGNEFEDLKQLAKENPKSKILKFLKEDLIKFIKAKND